MIRNSKINSRLYFWLCCAVLVQASLLNSQNDGWKKKYALSPGSNSYLALETPSGNFIELGITVDTNNNKLHQKLTLIGTDPSGNIQWRKDYGNLNFIYLGTLAGHQSAIHKINNSFYYTISAAVSDTGNSYKYVGLLIKFNYQGDTLWQRVYRDSIFDVLPSALTASTDNGFILTGRFQHPTGNNGTMVLKTDINGKELWRKIINKAIPNFSIGHCIIQDSATKRIIITGLQDIGNSINWYSYGSIMILDSLGTKLVHTTYNNKDSGPYLQVIQLKDKNFMAAGSITDHYDNVPYYKSQLVKFDTNGVLIWSKTYFMANYTNGARCLTELSNGDIMVLGTADTIIKKQFIGKNLIIFKIDKDGNLLSQKYTGHTAKDGSEKEAPSSFVQTKDKGFLISSFFTTNATPQTYSLIKLDSIWCDTLAAWCLSEALGVEETAFAKVRFKIYPNPANNSFTIDFDQYIENVILSISDLLGKEIKTALISNSQNQVDISDLKDGVYFVGLQNYSGKLKLIITR